MANVIRHKISQPTRRGLRKGDAVLGTGEENYGPTSTTGYVNGITPPVGGYVIYTLSDNDDPAMYVANTNEDLISIARTLGGGELNHLDAKNYLRRRLNTWVIDNIPNNTVTDELILHLDARNESSFLDNIPTTNLIYTNANVYQLGTASNTIFPVLFPGEVINGSSQGALSWTDHLRWYNETIPSGTTISLSGWYMVYNSNPSTAWQNSARLIIYSSAGYGGTVCDPGAWNTWAYFELTYTCPSDLSSFRLEDAGYDYYNSSDAPNTAAYTCNVQIETSSSPTPFTTGSRSQNTTWRDLSGAWRENVQYYTLYGLTYPEWSQTPASRDGITPGYDNITDGKLYNASRDVNYYVFDEDSNSWIDDSWFNGERINGHSYDTYDGQPNQHDQFNQDWDEIVNNFPNATHVVIASHAAERFYTNAEMLDKLRSIGLPEGVAGNNRPEFILVGKIGKPWTHKFVYENISSAVAKMNIGLPLEAQHHVDLYNGTSFNSNGWLEFDGSNDKAYSQIDFTWGNETTWTATVKRDTNNNEYNMFMGNFLPYFGFRGATNYKFHLSNDIAGVQRDVYSTTQTVTGKWYHVTFTTEYNGSNTTMRVFVNGIEENSATYSGAQTQRSGQSKRFTIGDGRSNAAWYPFDGSVSNIQIYNKKLSSSEVSQNYYGAPIVTSGLVASFDAGNLVSYDPSGASNTYSLVGSVEGNIVNGLAYSPSYGGVWDFDGSNDYIEINQVAPLIAGGDFTLSAWIKGGTQDHKGIIPINTSSGGNRALFLIRNASMGIYDSGTWYIGNIDVDDDQWHHVVLTYKRVDKRAIIYVDNQVSLNAITNNMITVATDDRVSIGQEWDGGSTSDHFNGYITAVNIYNKVLSPEEVAQNYTAQKARFGL